MKNHSIVDESVQGTVSQEVPSVAMIVEFLNRDLGLALRCLQGIHGNENLKRQLAEWMVGEIENYNNAKKASEVAK